MPAIKTEGIVLRHYSYSETSLLVHFFTQKLGKIKTLVKGAKKPKGKFFGRLELGSILDLLVHPNPRSDLHLVSDAALIETLEPLRQDLAKFAHAMVLLELVDTCFEVDCPNEEFYRDFILGLKEFANASSGPHNVTQTQNEIGLRYVAPNPNLWIPLVIQLKMLHALGLLPAQESCQECGKPFGDQFYFSFQKGALLCRACAKNAPGSVPGKAMQIPYLKMITEKTMQECLGAPFPGAYLKGFFGWTRNILDGVVHKRIRSYEFLARVGFDAG